MEGVLVCDKPNLFTETRGKHATAKRVCEGLYGGSTAREATGRQRYGLLFGPGDEHSSDRRGRPAKAKWSAV